MARRRLRRQLQRWPRRDRISELPADILDKILGFLPIEEAATMAVLSTFWRDMWFSLTQLNFDARFFNHIKIKYFHAHSDIWTQNIQEETEDSDIWTSVGFHVINKVLNQHNGLIRKFVFDFEYSSEDMLLSRSFDINQWLLSVTRKGVEEIHLSLMPEDDYISPMPEDKYRLPNCIFSSLTLRKLHLCGVSVEPINDPCILPNVTSLCFENVDFNPRNHPADVPMLENLSFISCTNMLHFNITAPKLGCLKLGDIDPSGGFIPVNLDLRSVRTLDLDAVDLEEFVEEFTRRGLRLQQPVLNVEYLKLLSNYDDQWDVNCSAFINLLRICPKLRTLDIDIQFAKLFWNCFGSESKLSEEFYSVAQTLKMLHTLKFSSVMWCETCMLTILGVFSHSPKFEKVVIILDRTFNSNDVLKFMEELSHFPRASTKALVLGQKRKSYNAKNPIVFLLK